MQFVKGDRVSTLDAFSEAIAAFGGRNKKVVVMNADTSIDAKTGKFENLYPDRHFNFGNAEANMVNTAAGFAARAKIPFATGHAIFITGKPWEHIRNSICLPNLNVKLVGTHAGILTGEEGAIFQALEDIAIMRAIPNMKVISPADAVETFYAVEEMMKDFGPTYLRLGHLDVPVVYSNEHNFRIGYGDILNFGEDISLIATGTMVHIAMEVAKLLEKEKGLRAMVVNMSSIKPLDEKLVLDCAKKTKMIVTLEDHGTIGGLGSAVAELVTEKFPTRVHKIGMEKFGESGKPADLYKKYALDSEGVYERILEKFKI